MNVLCSTMTAMVNTYHIRTKAEVHFTYIMLDLKTVMIFHVNFVCLFHLLRTLCSVLCPIFKSGLFIFLMFSCLGF